MNYSIQEMTVDDLTDSFLDALEQLGSTALSHEQARRIFEERARQGVITLVARNASQVIGTASMLIESKYIHDGGRAAHIEDVAVLPAHQHQGVGAALVLNLIERARAAHCYKIILSCSSENLPFYERLGFRMAPHQMRLTL